MLLTYRFLPLLYNSLEEHHIVPFLASNFHHKYLLHTRTVSLFGTAQSQKTSRSMWCLLYHLMGWKWKIWEVLNLIYSVLIDILWNISSFLNDSSLYGLYKYIFVQVLESYTFLSLVLVFSVCPYLGYKQLIISKTSFSARTLIIKCQNKHKNKIMLFLEQSCSNLWW
jgi:hypothetical protein